MPPDAVVLAEDAEPRDHPLSALEVAVEDLGAETAALDGG
jgi:hypothetical protein